MINHDWNFWWSDFWWISAYTEDHKRHITHTACTNFTCPLFPSPKHPATTTCSLNMLEKKHGIASLNSNQHYFCFWKSQKAKLAVHTEYKLRPTWCDVRTIYLFLVFMDTPLWRWELECTLSAKLKRCPSAHYALILVGLCLIWQKLKLPTPRWMINITKPLKLAVKPAF